jgi:alpha-N-arabinofuranosidase
MMMKKMTILAVALATAMFSAAQTAHFGYFKYTGNDSRFNQSIDKTRQYFNPIMAGFYPDPSVCRKGDTYYLVNSSFSFFPGVPIFTSKDLVNWTQIGHVLDRKSQLPLEGQHVSGGIFAPAISYNEKNKTFYMITTNVGAGNFYVKSKDPAKGWSEPIYLRKVGGIDPSFFFDKDGRGYIVNNDEPLGGHAYEGERSIMLHRFDVAGDSVVGDQIQIVRSGTHVQKNPIWIEGPHMYRIGKYYYLMCAEGGTGTWHSEVIFRAKSPEGPWEENKEGNPILTQRTGLDPNRADAVSSAGHADIVSTPDGKWYAVFLACRPYEEDYYNTGRDTYLLPVTWKDGWPTILKKDTPIPTVNDKPNLKPAENQWTGNFSYTDTFKDSKLNQRWMLLRNPTDFYTIGDGITIQSKDVNIAERKSPSAIFVRQQHTTFTAETQLSFTPRSEKDLAGFVLLQNEQYNFVFGETILNGKPAIVLDRAEGTNARIASVILSDQEQAKPIQLRIRGKGRYYDFQYASGNGEWQTLAKGVDAVNLSTGRSSGFIGACIGLYATANN